MSLFKELLIGFTVLIALALGYLYLPMEWRRHKDIQLGNTLISQVQNYQKQHNRLPENHEEAVLKQLGFRHNKNGWQPNYRKINAQQFQIIYADGFLPPHLAWDTQTQRWQLVDK
ncbi:hypothetical protein [Alysiella crassa]|uniref:Type II secretion system protein G n=1 Tax=Alysiella crassa TaxID=153491 RepID=A0A376BVY8_9NEIS|nr:hypothetical protein [Alysiella crassa]UOP06469.1 hypothetical protein LVJ80_12000 [Alysiella crassa]SSY81001.1 Uncharacterised protein [Alysiella crassa]